MKRLKNKINKQMKKKSFSQLLNKLVPPKEKPKTMRQLRTEWKVSETNDPEEILDRMESSRVARQRIVERFQTRRE